jgi:hypothetical protein
MRVRVICALCCRCRFARRRRHHSGEPGRFCGFALRVCGYQELLHALERGGKHVGHHFCFVHSVFDLPLFCFSLRCRILM